MSSINNSPVMSSESPSSGYSAPQKNETRDFVRRNRLPQSRTMMLTKNPFTSPPQSPSTRMCSCPDVLIADDDLFQHFYYQKLFQNYSFSAQSQDLTIQLCFSGEGLLKKYNQVKECGCSRLKLVITDYYMGNEKLNGVDTSIEVRSAGYEGTLLLRTSESAENLISKHANFQELCQEKVVELVQKCDLRQSKEKIQRCLEKK